MLTSTIDAPVVLVVEDQKSMALYIKQKLESTNIGCIVLNAFSQAEAEAIIKESSKIDICLCDLNLPDAAHGEIVPYLTQLGLTTVVFTSSYSPDIRATMYQHRVADYVIKDAEASIDYAVSTVTKIIQNPQHSIWIVAPFSSQSVQRIVGLLSVQKYTIKTFASFRDMFFALEKRKPDIVIIESAFEIADEDVFRAVSRIRKKYNASILPILSCESTNNLHTAIKLMKYGVTDFFNTGFTAEELYIRVRQSIDQSFAYKEIQRISQTDGLTGLYNRSHFFDVATPMYTAATKSASKLFTVMLDIDHFKQVNDTYGHQKGDEAIIFTANLVDEIFSDYLYARFGGEEYCVFGQTNNPEQIIRLCESFRERVAYDSDLETGVSFTASVGVSFFGDSVDDMIGHADKALYQSKETGRNKVSIAENS